MSNPSNQLQLPIHGWLLEQVQDAILFVDGEGTIVEGNQSAWDLLGASENMSVNVREYFDFDTLASQEETNTLLEVKDGSKRYFHVKSMKINNTNDQDLYSMILHSVSLNDKVKQAKQHMNKLIQGSFEGIVLHDRGNIIDCDETFARMFGYTVEEMVHRSAFDIVESRSSYKLQSMMSQFPEKPYELTGIKKDGSLIHVEIMAHPYPYQDRVLRGAIVRDITDRVEQEKRIEFMAYYDELTDLPNRTYFMKTLKEAIQQAEHHGEQLAVHFMDIDYFKQINDTLGYVFGDELLYAFAERLKMHHDEHNFIARMGGDEFLILQKGIQSKTEAEHLAQKIIKSFESPLQVEGLELFTSVSIGISSYPEDGHDSNDLIKHADSAMNVIKANNRNHYKVFESSISKDFKTILTMETELRKALKEDQLELHYQPQKNIETGQIVGLEALLRWKHPKWGYVPPATFIPLAEKTGLIFEIGEWVLMQACLQNKKWQNQGYPPFVVGVNLSAKQFYQNNLVDKVENILKESGLNANCLELEITESMAMSNEEDIFRTLEGLRALGVHVSIDDFGTGYSSLKYLSQFPISKLKIDRIFIHENRKQNEAIVKSIIHMSHSLNLKVIAEGVETEEQLEFLKTEQCDEMQGYYFSKPLPPHQLDRFFPKSV